ncbi:MAG TPA: tetratricopeptide repeat protein [bacterium]
MAKILKLPIQPPAKLGFEKVKKRRKKDADDPSQLSLFAGHGPSSARIVNLPSRLGPFEEALLLDELGDRQAAEKYWRAIEAGDGVADAYCNLGIIESHSGRSAKAYDCFTQSLKHDTRHMESHYNLGNLYFDDGDLRLARVHYEIAAELDPDFPNTYFNLGLALAICDDYSGAIVALSKYQDIVSPEEGSKAEELLATLKRSLAAQR